MFSGTTPNVIAQYFYSEINIHNPKKIFIPFAGNFAIEQISHQASPDSEIISTDVSIYSRAIGFGLTDQDFRLELKDPLREDFKLFASKKLPIEKAAVVIFFSEIAKSYIKKEKIKYYENLYKTAIKRQEEHFDTILSKLKILKEKTNFIFCGIDACEVLKEVKKGDIVIYDPPFYIDYYKKIYKALPECLEFEEVPFTDITEEIKYKQLEELNKIGAIVYFRGQREYDSPGYREVLRYEYKKNCFHRVYSNRHNKIFAGVKDLVNEKIVHYKILPNDFEFTKNTKIRTIKTTYKESNHYRFLWQKKAYISKTTGSYPKFVFADNYLMGVVVFDSTAIKSRYTNKKESNSILILADSCPPHKSRRLGKLVLYSIATNETLNELNEYFLWPHVGFTTKAYTNNPISMKYRGFFKLAKKEELNTEMYDFKYFLTYQKFDGFFKNTDDAYREWFMKYGRPKA